jgi:DNA-binding GntR family transcriptional regulator
LRAAEAADMEEFRRCDRAFHGLLAQASGNVNLLRLTEQAITLTSVLRERDLPARGDSVKCARQHVTIADALARGDEEQTGAAAGQHVLEVLDLVLARERQA